MFLSERTALDPDLSLSPAHLRTGKLTGPDVILAIEVSHSSLAYDRGLKARLYAGYGVPEYWVIDVKRRRTFVHTEPKEDASWARIEIREEGDLLCHSAVPRFRIKLSEI